MRSAYARYIGRVGALAVALGVSGAVATTPGVAWADESPSAASSSSAASESNPSSPSASDPSSTPRSSGSTASSRRTTSTTSSDGSTDESEGGTDSSDASASSSETVTTHESGVIVRSSGGALTSGGDDAAPATEDREPAGSGEDETTAPAELPEPVEVETLTAEAPPETPQTAPPAAHKPTIVPAQNDSHPPQVASRRAAPTPAASIEVGATAGQMRSPDDTAPAQLRTALATADPAADWTNQVFGATLTAPPPPASSVPEPTAPLMAVPSTFIGVAANLLNAALAPILAPGPTGPIESPVLWAVLGWVRRQSTRALADYAPVSTVEETSQIESPGTAEEVPVEPVEEVAALAAADLQTDAAVAAVQAGLPAEFERTTIVSGLDQPTDFRFLPDGRILISEKGGAIKVYEDGQLNNEPLVTLVVLPTDTDEERGLLGIEVDPRLRAHLREHGYLYLCVIHHGGEP